MLSQTARRSAGVRVLRRMLTIPVLLLLLLRPDAARAEGEHWVPLYNKLARMLNERSLAAGSTFNPNQGETQAQADQRYIDTNGTLSPMTVVTQDHLQTLRSRVIALATSNYIVPNPTTNYEGATAIPTLFAYVIVNGQHVQDHGVDVLRSPSIFELAELPNSNAFTKVPGAYGTESYSNSFTDVPVFWEHFQELYSTIQKLEWTKTAGNWISEVQANYRRAWYAQPGFPWEFVLEHAVDAYENNPEIVSSVSGAPHCTSYAFDSAYLLGETTVWHVFEVVLQRQYAYYQVSVSSSLPASVEFLAFAQCEGSPPDTSFWNNNGDGLRDDTYLQQDVYHRWDAATRGASGAQTITSAVLGDTGLDTPAIFDEGEEPCADTPTEDNQPTEDVHWKGYAVTDACAIVKWTFTAWKDIAPTSIKLVSFCPPKDPDTDALVASCVSCAEGTCNLEYHLKPPACGRLPGVSVFLGISASWYGPTLNAYISQGNTTMPHSGLALGPTADPQINAAVRDAGILQSFSLGTCIVADTQDFVSVLRPTGRIVTFNRTTGKPLGPDTGNSYRLYVISEENEQHQSEERYYDIVFGDRIHAPEALVIHRYKIEDGTLYGVARGPSFDTGETCSGTPGDWPGLTWNTTAPLTSVVTPRFDVLLTGNPVSVAVFRTPVTLGNLARITLTRESSALSTAIKELWINNAWVQIDSLIFTPTFDQDSGQLTKWTVTRPGDADRTVEESVDEENATRTVREKVVLGVNQTAVRNARVYGTLPWGEEIIAEMPYEPDDPAPAGLAPTTYQYYTDADNDGDNYGHLKQIVNADGSWARYEYADDRVISETSGFKDTAPDDENGTTQVTTYSYAPLASSGDDGSLAPNVPRTTVVTIGSQEVSRSYLVVLANATHSIRCATVGAEWDATTNLVTLMQTYASGDWQGHTRTVTNPDGTVTLFAYEAVNGGLRTTTWSGPFEKARQAVVDGTKSVSVVDAAGRALLSETYDIASGLLVARSAETAFDDFGRTTRTDYLDGTFTATIYGCCGPEVVTDREGMQTQYLYDDQKRVEYEARAGITMHYIYDVDGNVTSTERIGSDNSRITLSTSEHDASGRLLSSTDALGKTTFFAEGFTPAGGKTRTTLYADDTASTETYARDGSPLSVGGSAAHPLKYEYGVDATGPFTKTIRGGAGGAETEWAKSYVDMLGRQYKTMFPDGVTSQAFYNSAGQLVQQIDAGGVSMLYAYNARGEQEYVAVDMNRDGVMDVDGTDRIVRSQNSVLAARGTTVRRTAASVWATDGSAIPTVTAVNDASVDGRQSWSESFGLTAHSETVIDPNTRTKTVTATGPDGAYSITTYQNGRMIWTARYGADRVRIARTGIAYDAHGRQATVTDARTGDTTYAYNTGDQVTALASPDPDGAGPELPQTTHYAYDSRGRQAKVTLPDGGVVEYAYWPTGELRKTWGACTYPVAYSYDTQGRLATLTTWQKHAQDSGAAVTAWQYDPVRGWFVGKQYADGSGPTYTYTTASRLEKRTWARGVTTTYVYNNAGEPAAVHYSDATPAVAFTYDRMGRRLTATDGAGTQTLAYALSGELLSETRTGGPLDGVAVAWSYDNLHRRSGLDATRGQASLASTGYGYDAASRLRTVTSGANRFTYNYIENSGTLVGSLIAANGTTTVMTTTKVYDNLNRLLDIASATGAPASPQSRYSYVYDAANQRSRATLADGSYWVYKYDALGQVIGGVKNDANGIPLPGFAFGYAFDDIGNRTSTSSSTAAAPSVYDANPLNQYEQRTVPGVVDIVGRANPAATVTLTIQDGSTRDILPVEHRGDFWWMTLAVENANSAKWLGITVTGVRNNIGPNGEDAVTEQRGHRFIPKTPELFTYDADGNLTADGRWSYTWDAENRLIAMETLPSVLPAPRSRLVFTYDALSRRIAKKVFAWSPDHWSLLTDHLFVYDGWNLIAELALDVQSSTLSVQRSYVWGLDLSGSLQGAGGVGGLLAVRLPSTAGGGAGGEGSTHLACYDGNGNIVALFDAATGAESATFEYSPFGETLVQSYADPLARQSLGDGGFRFSTKYTDPETGLLYYGYRYYSPSLGRWLGRDPVEEEGGENVYGLVGNSPSTFFDPVGLAIYAFDGTGNNMSDPNAGPITNVAILFNAYNGLHRRYYAGIGTDGDSISGGLTGNGGQLILRQAYEHLQANFEEGDKEIVIIGFSRGAALARNFANMISRRGNPGTWAGTDMPYARSANQEAGRCPPEIKFLGVFDTVASFGIPDNDVDFMYSFGVPSNVKVARHATARHERRGSFALMSMLPYAGWSDPTGRIVENTFDGAHADVGGGYADNGLSIHSLMWMAQEGRNAGVDFGPLDISTIRNHKAVLHNSAPGFDVLSKLFGTDHPAIGSIGSWLNERSKRKIFYPDSTAPETIQ